MSTKPFRFRNQIAAVSLLAAGVAGGGVLASTMVASAADAGTSTTATTQSGTTPGAAASGGAAVDESQSQRADETLLTGTDAAKATAAALAKYPGATIQRVETDSDGVFEAHIVTADGERLIVAMDASFAVTGTGSHAGYGG